MDFKFMTLYLDAAIADGDRDVFPACRRFVTEISAIYTSIKTIDIAIVAS